MGYQPHPPHRRVQKALDMYDIDSALEELIGQIRGRHVDEYDYEKTADLIKRLAYTLEISKIPASPANPEVKALTLPKPVDIEPEPIVYSEADTGTDDSTQKSKELSAQLKQNPLEE